MIKAKNQLYKKIALAFSLCVLIVWGVLGTGASLAWFSDTSDKIKNIFHMAEFDLEVSYRLENGDYDTIEGSTDLFDKDALYEPGYVEVVHIRIDNNGSVPFDYYTAISVIDFTPGENVFGIPFNLQDHLKFGIVAADTEAELLAKIPDRESALSYATTKLGNYSNKDNPDELGAGQSKYAALIVCMPKKVTNEANHKTDTKMPKVELGIIVSAQQQKQN